MRVQDRTQAPFGNNVFFFLPVSAAAFRKEGSRDFLMARQGALGVYIMTTRMLIDARHREETRVAVTKGNRIEEFDFESAEHKQLKGNIYLAKVTRVEPSLQAAFVEYGGNRHGFLAFSEIHPDYYQIPKEDRDALLREEAEHAAAAAQRAEEDLDELEGDVADVEYHDEDENGDSRADRDDDRDDHDDHDDRDDNGDAENGDAEEGAEGSEEGREGNGDGRGDRRGRGRGRGNNNRKGGRGRSRRNDDEDGENRMSLRRRYKIQDVIRRRQVMLVQVVKEERGNKGAALTTYLSLAGRYCVLMPNTMHGGGISRKISNGADRRKLKAMIDELALPPTMGCIVRTAGMSRTKVEIKRDFDYLARLWDEIRENTLGSSAPALIHSDSDLVKRAIRDIYHKDIEEVLVEGDEGYKAAKQFMKLLMPSHARRVKQYADPVSLYQRYGVEDQLAGMLNPVVQLKSGGYLVINPTEALVSIDINSGRSTREHNIEQTALSTNLEAAHEIARQLRLRDMAGLVVIDFIDMDHGSNVRKVERAMKDALKNDRARIRGRPHLGLRPDGDEPPAPAHRRARSFDAPVPALRRHRPRPHRLVGGPQRAAPDRRGSRTRQGQQDHPAREPGSDLLPPQRKAPRTPRDRGTLRRHGRNPARRRDRGRAHGGRGQRPAADRAPQLRPDRADRGR